MPNWKKVITSGSDAQLRNLGVKNINVSGSATFDISGSGVEYHDAVRIKSLSGGVDVLNSIGTFLNPSGSKRNDTYSIGWNLAVGGVNEVAGETALGFSFENHYATTAGNQYHEMHLMFIDATGSQHRPITYFMHKNNRNLWTGADMVQAFEFRSPYNDSPYFRFYTDSSTVTYMRIMGYESGVGAAMYVDTTNKIFGLTNHGMVNPSINLMGFYVADVSRLVVANAYGGSATQLWGKSPGGAFEMVNTGDNITLLDTNTLRLSGNVVSASSQVTFAGISGKPSGLVSSSAQLTSTFAPRTNPTFTGSVKIPDAAISGLVTLGQNVGVQIYNALSTDGNYSGLIESGTAGAALSYGDLSYRSGSSGRWVRASAVTESKGGYVRLGMCIDATTGAAQGTSMLLYGSIRADAKFPTLTVGRQVFVGVVTGSVHFNKPSGSNQVVRVVGFANSADEIFFSPSPDYITHT
jgi:hypothetical protein